MLRIIVKINDAREVAGYGGDEHVSYKTFDCELPEVEAFLTENVDYVSREVKGIEVLYSIPKGAKPGRALEVPK